ncbi:Ca(2+)/H(+) antiporter (ApCAX), partial [Durusdinium trenchii]
VAKPPAAATRQTTLESAGKSNSYVAPPSQRGRRPSMFPVDSTISLPDHMREPSSGRSRSGLHNPAAAGLLGALKFKGLLNVRLKARRARLGGARDECGRRYSHIGGGTSEQVGGAAELGTNYGSIESTGNQSLVEVSCMGPPEKTTRTDILAVREYILGNKVCIFLLLIPFGTIAALLNWGDEAVFLLNFFAILPLAQLLGDFTEEVALYTNDTVGGLLNATLGNATELIISIFAIQKNLLRVVQVSLLGSVLSNELLVTGCCFLFGGLYHKEQHFNAHIAAIDSSLLLMAVLGLSIPAAFSSTTTSDCHVPCRVESIEAISHYTALMLFFLYGMLLVFQLKTHTHLMDVSAQEHAEDRAEIANAIASEEGATASGAGEVALGSESGTLLVQQSGSEPEPGQFNEAGGIQDSFLMTSGQPSSQSLSEIIGDEQDPEEATMTLKAAIIMLTITTLLVALCSELLVGSIESVSKSWGLSEVFIGLILLPIIGNAAEHATAITVAMKGKMDLALGVALGSSVQIALCVVPALCLVGWSMGKPLTLDFHPFETIVLVISVLVVTSTVRQGTSTWLEGIMLIISYCIIALAYFYRKEPPSSTTPSEPSCVCGEPCCFVGHP